MASIAALTKTFNSGTNGNSASSAFSNVTGSFNPVYTNSPALEGAMSIRFTAPSTTDQCQAIENDSTQRGIVYRLFRLRLESTPTANTYIVTCFNNGSPGDKVADVRVNTDRTLSLRDNITARFTGTVQLALNTTYFISLKINPAGDNMFIKLYNSSGVLLEGSPSNVALTSTTQAAVDNWRWGVINSGSAFTWVLDDLKADDSAELFPPSTGVVANAGPDQTNQAEGKTVTLSASASGGTGSYTYSWSQTAGTTVSLTGTGATRTYVVPSLASAETATFQVTATDSGSVSGSDSVNVGHLSRINPNAGVDQSGITAGSTVTLSASASGGSGTGFVYTWTQLAGTTVSLSGTGATRTYTAPTLASPETQTFRVSVTDSLGSTAKTDTVDISILAASSTAISAYTKSYNGGTNNASASAAFDNVTGTAPTYTTSTVLEGNSSIHFATTANNTHAYQIDNQSRSTVYRLFRMQVHTRPAGNVAFVQWYQSSSPIGSVRLTSTGTLQLRDFNTTTVFSGTQVLANDTMYYLAIKVIPNTSTGHRYKLYDASGTLLEDSGNRAATAAALSTVDNFHFGILANDTMDWVLDDTKGDTTFELFPPSSTIVPNAGADQTNKPEGATVALSGSATGGTGSYTYSWSQISGTTVSLSGSGSNRTFTVPALASPETAVFRVTVNDGVNAAQTDDVSIGLLASIVPDAGPDQTSVDAYSTVTLTGSATGGSGTGYVYTWTQLSGTPVTLSGSGATRTFTAKALATTETATFRVSITDSLGSVAKTDDVAVTIIQHDNFTKIGGVTVPYRVWQRQGGVWVA